MDDCASGTLHTRGALNAETASSNRTPCRSLMPGQGEVVQSIVHTLTANGWRVAFSCLPNTAHVNVVPIPLRHRTAKQRYPDIVATNEVLVRLIEVEMQ